MNMSLESDPGTGPLWKGPNFVILKHIKTYILCDNIISGYPKVQKKKEIGCQIPTIS